MASIIIFALIAVFLGLRLYSVLGERTGHEQAAPQPLERDPADEALSPATPASRLAAAVNNEADGMAFLPTAGPGVRAMLAADPEFNVAQFLEGAKAAYGMILEAYWKGDLSEVEEHVDDHILDAFQGAIAARAKAGQILDNRLVRIDQALITEATVDKVEALMTVRFDADITAVTRDKDGNVIAGSLSDAVETHDKWTFRRAVQSADPNWLLVETDED